MIRSIFSTASRVNLYEGHTDELVDTYKHIQWQSVCENHHKPQMSTSSSAYNVVLKTWNSHKLIMNGLLWNASVNCDIICYNVSFFGDIHTSVLPATQVTCSSPTETNLVSRSHQILPRWKKATLFKKSLNGRPYHVPSITRPGTPYHNMGKTWFIFKLIYLFSDYQFLSVEEHLLNSTIIFN